MDDERQQPTREEVQEAVRLFPGPVVHLRSFRTSAKRAMRTITEGEFASACSSMPEWGRTCTAKPPGSRTSKFFIKKHPDTIQWAGVSVPKQDYSERYSRPVNKTITPRMLQQLVTDGHIPAAFLENPQ